MAVLQVGVITGDTTVLFSSQIMKYSEQRIPTLNEYCVVCDEQHVFQNGSMLKVSERRRRRGRNKQYRLTQKKSGKVTSSTCMKFSFCNWISYVIGKWISHRCSCEGSRINSEKECVLFFFLTHLFSCMLYKAGCVHQGAVCVLLLHSGCNVWSCWGSGDRSGGDDRYIIDYLYLFAPAAIHCRFSKISFRTDTLDCNGSCDDVHFWLVIIETEAGSCVILAWKWVKNGIK